MYSGAQYAACTVHRPLYKPGGLHLPPACADPDQCTVGCRFRSDTVGEGPPTNRQTANFFVGTAVPHSVDGSGSPSNTMSPGPRPTPIIYTGILIQPTDWPQYTNVTDRQTDRIDRTTVP